MTDDDGAQVYKSGCPSGGTVDLLIEPYLPPPMLGDPRQYAGRRAMAAHGTGRL